jgi:hypothetical protein
VADDGKTEIYHEVKDSLGNVVRDEQGKVKMARGYDADTVKAAQKQKEQLAAVAETFMSRYGSAAAGGGGGEMDPALVAQMERDAEVSARAAIAAAGTSPDSPDGQRQIAAAVSQAQYSAQSSGAGSVAQRVVEFARLTGRYAPIDHAPDSPKPNDPPIRPLH